MNDLRTLRHDLQRDIHNIMSLLKFIDKDEDLKDPDLKTMLEMALSRESSIIDALNILGKSEKTL